MSKFKVGDPVRPALHIAGRWRKLLNVSEADGDMVRINRSKIWYNETDFQHAPIKQADPYAELKQAVEDGHTIQVRINPTGNMWVDISEPRWGDPVERYRIKPNPIKPPVRHVHADLIKVWIEDMLRPVQFWYVVGEKWVDIKSGNKPTWSPLEKYRFKPSQAELDLMDKIDSIKAELDHDTKTLERTKIKFAKSREQHVNELTALGIQLAKLQKDGNHD
ncbi:hypothetical protein OAP32_00515 [Crocinitomicaceae bacterium]|nr:hypothetical protein [Crocinitomicaceae bacterium]